MASRDLIFTAAGVGAIAFAYWRGRRRQRKATRRSVAA